MSETQRPAIRMLGLDLDGTVFNDEKKVTPATRNAIARAGEAGVVVLPVTGRPRRGIPDEIVRLPGLRYAITSNGAAGVDLLTGETLFVHPLALPAALNAVHRMENCDVMLDVYVDGRAVTSPASIARIDRFAPPAMRAYFRASRTAVPDLAGWLAACGRPVEKLSVLFGSEVERQTVWQMLAADARYCVTSSIPNNLEVNAAGVNKGMALLALAGKLGIDPRATMACGDSSNDIEMLRAAGLGVAMGNASPEVMRAADAVTATNNEDGVARAIERYILHGGE